MTPFIYLHITHIVYTIILQFIVFIDVVIRIKTNVTVIEQNHNTMYLNNNI